MVHELRFMAPPRAGSYEMELQVLSDCYLGLDQSITIKFDVLPAADLPEYAAHPEDLELDNDPTIFEQVWSHVSVRLDHGNSNGLAAVGYGGQCGRRVLGRGRRRR